ncbi:MAG TPA: tetratricopeptide repeat protein, partial [Terriglobales bacterium]
MNVKHLTNAESQKQDRKPGGMPKIWAVRLFGLCLLASVVLATVACDDGYPGLTSEELRSDPLPEFNDAAFVGLWLSDGEYVSFEVKDHGVYLLHPPEKENGEEPEEAIPFQLKRAGDLLMMEYSVQTDGGKVFRPCWVNVQQQALELYCLRGNNLAELGIEFETRKSGEDEVNVIRASQDDLKRLYNEQALNKKFFEPFLRMTRPQPERVARLKRRAMRGSGEAQEMLAEAYRAGEIVATDKEEARNWACRAAESGRSSGQVLYADLLVEQANANLNELEKESLQHEALTWYQRAAEQKYPKAFSRLGSLYENSFFEDDSSAVDSYRRGAELGDAESFAQLGIRYYEGKGVPQSEAEALNYLEKVPEGSRGYTTWATLATIYLDALEPEHRDLLRAVHAAEKAVEDYNAPDAHALLARGLLRERTVRTCGHRT